MSVLNYMACNNPTIKKNVNVAKTLIMPEKTYTLAHIRAANNNINISTISNNIANIVHNYIKGERLPIFRANF